MKIVVIGGTGTIVLFVKRFDYREGAVYPDRGTRYQTFSNEDMLEMETVGELVTLQPGAFVLNTSVVDDQLAHSYDQWVKAARFDVVPGTPRESGGVLVMGSRWGNLRTAPAVGDGS